MTRLRQALAAGALVLTAYAPALAQEEGAQEEGAAGEPRAAAAPGFDVMRAIEGVWAYDPRDVDAPGDFTCGERPIAFAMVDQGARIASMRYGDAAERYGLVIDVREDFPLGPALSIAWEGADGGEPEAAVLFMEDEDTFAWLPGATLQTYLEAEGPLESTARRTRCETGAGREPAEDAAD